MFKNSKLLIPMMGLTVSLVACEKGGRTFSLLDAGSSFQQSGTYVPRPIDVLWVVDNSGSMDSSQVNLTNSFQSFVTKFQEKNYDFHMAVTGTDAWKAAYQSNVDYKNILRRARRGPITGNATVGWSYSPDSGFNIMDTLTPNLTDVFLKSAKLGTTGTGDERAFSSFYEFLHYAGNSDFRRNDAILAIIVVSDEDDFSANTSAYVAGDYDDEVDADPVDLAVNGSPTSVYQLYQDPRLLSVQSFKDDLDGIVGAGNYSVNMIGIKDTQCKANLNVSYGGRRIGRRYIQLADMTGGVKTSLCDNFGDSLQLISDSIVKLTSTFKLNREPVISTLHVVVNGVNIPEDATNGWTYNATDWSVTFNGTSVPAQGDNIQILFTPAIASN